MPKVDLEVLDLVTAVDTHGQIADRLLAGPDKIAPFDPLPLVEQQPFCIPPRDVVVVPRILVHVVLKASSSAACDCVSRATLVPRQRRATVGTPIRCLNYSKPTQNQPAHPPSKQLMCANSCTAEYVAE